MNNITYKYNRFLITFLAISPILSYFIEGGMGISFKRVFQLLSYLGVILIVFFKNKNIPLKISNYLIFYLLFTFYVFYSELIVLNRAFKIEYLFSNNMISALNMIFIIENFPISKKYFNFIFILSKNILVIAFLVIVYQATIDDSFYMIPMNMEAGSSFTETEFNIRLKSIYSYLGYLTFGFGFLPVMIWVVEALDKRKKKILIWVFMSIIYAFLSKARWLMINTLLIFLVLMINHKLKLTQALKYLFVLIAIIMTSFYVLNIVGIDTDKIINERILESHENNLSNTSAGTRLLAFKVFNDLFWEHPLLGIGNIKYGMGGTGKNDYKLRSALNGHSSQIHVGHINVLYTYGIIGGFFFFSFLYLLLRHLFKSAKITKVWAPFVSVIGFVLVNFTQVSFTFFEMGLIIVIFVNKYHMQGVEVNTKLYA